MSVLNVRPYEPGDADAFTSIYETSFPVSERLDTAVLLDNIARGVTKCSVASSNGAAVGIAVYSHLGNLPVTYLTFLATDPAIRNSGIGGQVLQQVRADLSTANDPPQGMLFEVDTIRDRTVSDYETRVRRVNFYRRQGAQWLEEPSGYFAPDESGEGAPTHFDLMWLSTGGDRQPSPDLLRASIPAIYGLWDVDSSDPLVARALSTLDVPAPVVSVA